MNLILAVQMVSALAMIGLILIQHGKGADMGAAFGSGSSGSLFGATGSSNFLSRTTAILATVFFVATLSLAYFGNLRTGSPAGGSVLEGMATAVPVAPAPASAASIAATSLPASVASGAAQIPSK
jgi:preprotein translocase subunit SecG